MIGLYHLKTTMHGRPEKEDMNKKESLDPSDVLV